MAISITADSATVGATEYFLLSDSTTKTSQTDDAIVQLFLVAASMAAADQFAVKIYEKVNSVEINKVLGYLTLDSPEMVVPAFLLGEGWEFSVQKKAGADRTVNWSVRKAT